MNKVSIFLLGLALTLVTAQGDCSNPMIGVLGLNVQPGTPATPATPTGTLAFCKTLTTICCLQTDITDLETTVKAKLTALATSVTTRDTNLLAARAAVAAKSANFTLFKAAATAAATSLATMIAATPTVSGAQEVSDHAVEFSGYVTKVITEYSDIRTAFDDYQTARQTCVQEIMKVQAQVYCLACSADPEANGVDTSGFIDYAPATVTALLNACQPYVVASAAQNVIFNLATQVDNIEAMTAALVLIAANTEAGVAAYQLAISTPDAPASTVAVLPPGTCTLADCDWITTALLPVTGEVDTALLALGGAEATRRRILEEARLLQTTWTPIESGVAVAFAKDPSGLGNPVDDMSAVIRNGVISCIAAVFVTLLL